MKLLLHPYTVILHLASWFLHSPNFGSVSHFCTFINKHLALRRVATAFIGCMMGTCTMGIPLPYPLSQDDNLLPVSFALNHSFCQIIPLMWPASLFPWSAHWNSLVLCVYSMCVNITFTGNFLMTTWNIIMEIVKPSKPDSWLSSQGILLALYFKFSSGTIINFFL